MMLSDDDIRAVFHSEFKNRIDTLHFARAIEAKVRQQDEALLRQCLEAFIARAENKYDLQRVFDLIDAAIEALKARLGEA